MTASVAIAIAPDGGTEPARVLKGAKIAPHKGKMDDASGARLLAPEMDEEMRAQPALEKLIREAAASDGFNLHYEPVFEIPGDKLVGFEAVLRLRNASGDFVPPAVFIPLARKMGLIGKISEWALHQTCQVAKKWPDGLQVSVKLLPAQFEAGNLCEVLAAALEASGLAPRRLELEISESLLLRDGGAVMAKLSRLRALGAAIVLNGFGADYSSLSYLWRFPFDKIKIDRTFLRGLDSDRQNVVTIVKTIIELARSVRMQVTMEGTANARQVTLVRDARDDQVKELSFSRPTPAADTAAAALSDFLRTMHPPAATTA